MPTILFDLDGVILKHNKVHKHVATKCTKFVSKTIGMKNFQKAATLNERLYKENGHTLLGLYHLGYDVTLHQFNSYVYDDINYTKFFNKTAMQKQYSLTNLSRMLRIAGADCFIYSNASSNYIEQVKVAFDLDWETVPVNRLEYIKPQPSSFSFVHSFLGVHEADKDDVLFIDDSCINIHNAKRYTSWQCLKVDYDQDLSCCTDQIFSFLNVKDINVRQRLYKM